MKTLRLQPNILFLALFLSISTFIGCGDSEIEGCTNAFATNYKSDATVDCCCEYDVEALVDELIGTYDYKTKISDFEPGYHLSETTIEKDPEDKTRFLINDYWIRDLVGTFEDGEFILKSEVWESLGCYSQTKGKLFKEGNILKMEAEYRAWGNSQPPAQFSCDFGNFSDEGEMIKR